MARQQIDRELKRWVTVGPDFVGQVLYRSDEEFMDIVHSRHMKGLNLGTLFNKPGSPVDWMANGRPTTLTIEQGDSSPVVYNTEAAVLAFVPTGVGAVATIWQKTLNARQWMQWGSGQYGVINNQGYAKFLLMKAATGFQQGEVRLVIASTDLMNVPVVPGGSFFDSEAHLADYTSLTSATPTNNQTGEKALPRLTGITCQPYSKMQIAYETLVNVASLDTAYFAIPATIKTT